MSTLIVAFDITPEKDADGNDIPMDPRMTDLGTLQSVRLFPQTVCVADRSCRVKSDFICRIAPRSEAYRGLVENSISLSS